MENSDHKRNKKERMSQETRKHKNQDPGSYGDGIL